jgi:hypothetical protein
MVVNEVLIGMWKEEVVAYFKVSSQNLHAAIEENHEYLQST